MVSSDATTPTEAVDLMHFVNTVVESTVNNNSDNGRQIQTEKDTLGEARSKGARLIVPGFNIPNNNPKNVICVPDTANQTLK